MSFFRVVKDKYEPYLCNDWLKPYFYFCVALIQNAILIESSVTIYVHGLIFYHYSMIFLVVISISFLSLAQNLVTI